MLVVEMQVLVSPKENAGTRGREPKKYSSRHRLRKDMKGDHSVFGLFVSGSSTGSATSFHCMICRRDVSLQSRGAREFTHLFSSDRHWLRDVTYRVQHDLPVYIQ